MALIPATFPGHTPELAYAFSEIRSLIESRSPPPLHSLQETGRGGDLKLMVVHRPPP